MVPPGGPLDKKSNRNPEDHYVKLNNANNMYSERVVSIYHHIDSLSYPPMPTNDVDGKLSS
jgi:hypothetical protein